MPRHQYSFSNKRHAHTTIGLSNKVALSSDLFKVLQKNLELSFLKAASHYIDPDATKLPDNVAGSESLESLIYEALKTLKEPNVDLVKHNLDARMRRVELLRDTEYKEYYQRGVMSRFNDAVSLFDETMPLANGEYVHAMNLAQLDNVPVMHTLSGVSGGSDMNVHLLIHEIKCEDETDPEGGSDEILLSGILIHPYDPATHVIKTTETPKYTIGDFNESEQASLVKTYAPPILLATYEAWKKYEDLIHFPKVCACSIILCEADNGGFPEIVKKILRKIKEKIEDHIDELVAAGVLVVVSGVVGAAIGFVLGPIVAVLVGELLDELINLIITVWEDDVFPPINVSVTFNNKFSTFNSNLTSPKYVEVIEGHGGRYSITYSWRMDGVIYIPSPAGEEQQKGATIYKDVNFEGDQKFLPPGEYSFGRTARPGSIPRLDPFDNAIDSIKVDSGYYAQVYKEPNLTGDMMEILHDTPKPWFDDNFRDQISSIKVGSLTDRIG